jgi:cellulose synthase/poly-beta-1,6-N-acetylglucosamine synthase-like glycosyltransferase
MIPTRNERGKLCRYQSHSPVLLKRLRLSSSKVIPATAPGMRSSESPAPIRSQPGVGKADAAYAGFDAASGDVLMILDADLTMPPEQLPKFWEAIHRIKESSSMAAV